MPFGINLSPDWAAVIVAFFALVVSLIAVILAVVEGWQSRKYIRLSARPCVTFETNGSEADNEYSIQLENMGAGVAIIEKYSISWDEESLITDRKSNLTKKIEEKIFLQLSLLGVKAIKVTSHKITDDDTAIVPGGKRNLVHLKILRGSTPKIDEIDELLRHLRFKVCYKSVYGDKETTIWPREGGL